MAHLEELTRGSAVKGILPDGLVTVVDVKWIGTVAVEVTYKDAAGRLGNELLYRDREPTLEIAEVRPPWSFDGDGGLFRLVSEANRIRLAYLFDPLLAVHTSLVDPLPHQITAVYGEMLPRQPLRFLLADDPGAGKTIMTGLFIKELMARGDLQRCLIVCPGNLAEQWQDELDRRFHLPFEIMTNDALEAARTGNWFPENPLAICRLDKLSRDEDVQAKLQQTDWDLIVCDEAHKLSATYFGSEVKYTKRYRLGQLLSTLTRHFLLLTATPHNGKEADFQLFMALLDGDRFEGKFRDGVHVADASDMMRRLVKEQLLKFDGTPLFPERTGLHRELRAVRRGGRALQAGHRLRPRGVQPGRGPGERRQQGHRRLRPDDPPAPAGVLARGDLPVAATTARAAGKAAPRRAAAQARRPKSRVDMTADLPALTADDLDDLDDAPDAEVEATEERVVDQASAARTIAELRAEIAQLQDLETHRPPRAAVRHRPQMGRAVAAAAEQLRDVRRRRPPPQAGHLHRAPRHAELPGRADSRAARPAGGRRHIHGGIGREERRKAQEAFTHDKEVEILVATDAAGEGINLQRAHLMVNYDLPWNPNRLEQRFGRIHRIGQTEVCHLWNLVAKDTREGEVYHRLLEKLDEEREGPGRPGLRRARAS